MIVVIVLIVMIVLGIFPFHGHVRPNLGPVQLTVIVGIEVVHQLLTGHLIGGVGVPELTPVQSTIHVLIVSVKGLLRGEFLILIVMIIIVIIVTLSSLIATLIPMGVSTSAFLSDRFDIGSCRVLQVMLVTLEFCWNVLSIHCHAGDSCSVNSEHRIIS